VAQTVGLSIKLKVLEVDQAKTVCGHVKKKKADCTHLLGKLQQHKLLLLQNSSRVEEIRI